MTLLAINWSNTGMQALQFILSFSILVTLHELGHFLTARWFKCRVEKFYLFFNPWFSLWKKKIGETEYGLKLIGEGLRAQRIGVQSWLGTLLTISATAHMQCGNPGRALEMLAEAIAHMERTGARVGLPETERLHAEVLLLTNQIGTTEAIARVEAAARLAQQQGALALEWRATMSLARLLSKIGRHVEARDRPARLHPAHAHLAFGCR